jgi:hypothetical protein
MWRRGDEEWREAVLARFGAGSDLNGEAWGEAWGFAFLFAGKRGDEGEGDGGQEERPVAEPG